VVVSVTKSSGELDENEEDEGNEENGENCEQASVEITVASHDSMIAARVAGDEGETSSDVAETLARVLEIGREVSRSEPRRGFE